jgi:hypothetical protein
VIITVSIVLLAGANLTKYVSRKRTLYLKWTDLKNSSYYFTIRGTAMINIASSSNRQSLVGHSK